MYVGRNSKGLSIFARRDIVKGEYICEYRGDVCTYKTYKERNAQYNLTGKGSCYILEFKHRDRRWAIDATRNDQSFGRLINHSRKFPNIKPHVEDKDGKPRVIFFAIRFIPKDDELLYDYGDNCKESLESFPWLKQ